MNNKFGKLSKDFKRIFVTDNLSFIMNKILLFAMPLWIMEVTKSAVILSVYNSLIVLVSVLISPISGIVSDKMNKVLIIKVGNILKLLSVFFILLLLGQEEKNVYLIIGVFILRYLCISIINPSTSSLIIHIVDKNELENAVYYQQITTQVLQILTPTIAGVLVSVLSYRNIYLIDMSVILIVLFLLSGISYKFDNQGFQKKEREKSSVLTTGVIKKIPGGNAFFVFLLCAAIINVLGSAMMLSMQVYVVNDEINKVLVGVLFAASPLGGIIGSLIAKRIGLHKFKVYHSMILVSLMGIFNVFMGICAHYHQISGFIITYFLSGIFFGLSNTQFGIYYKKYIPQEVQGRFFGFLNSMLLMATPVGNLVNGLFIELVNETVSIFLLGAITSVAGIIFAGITKKMFHGGRDFLNAG